MVNQPVVLQKEPLSSEIGEEMYSLIKELYPICRSVTGDGLRATLHILSRYIPLEVREVPTGRNVFDWTVPKEWKIRDAYVKNKNGERIIDFQRCNLHVVSYSVPIQARMSLSELKKHLYSLPDRPNWIPYRTSHYSEAWGFCVEHKHLLELEEGEYEVCVDSSLVDGSLTYGEILLTGRLPDKEILLSCHICHPSLCNDNLSGIALVTFLARHLSGRDLRYSYRFLFVPATIGAITWLALNEANVRRVKNGLVVACVGDPGKMTYKRSRRGNVEIDRAAIKALADSGDDYEVVDFSPYGYDECQFCSPAFDLPVGSLTRTPHGQFPEYHTSADDLDLVRPSALADSFAKYLSVLRILEGNRKYLNKNPKCEPQLGKRGLYRAVGGARSGAMQLALLWVLNLSDGNHDLLAISERSGLKFELIENAANLLLATGLLKECDDERFAF